MRSSAPSYKHGQTPQGNPVVVGAYLVVNLCLNLLLRKQSLYISKEMPVLYKISRKGKFVTYILALNEIEIHEFSARNM